MWAERLDIEDTETKLDALEAINSFGGNAINIEHRLNFVARYDKNNKVRFEAITLLAKLNISTVEFSEFMELYDSPLFPVAEDDTPLYGTGKSELIDKASVMDDLNYLKELVEGVPEDSRVRVVVAPTNSVEFEEWVNSQRSNGIYDLKQMLSNPNTLLGLFRSGDELEKTFAIERLSKLENLDPKILEELLKMTSIDENASLNSADISNLLQQQR